MGAITGAALLFGAGLAAAAEPSQVVLSFQMSGALSGGGRLTAPVDALHFCASEKGPQPTKKPSYQVHFEDGRVAFNLLAYFNDTPGQGREERSMVNADNTFDITAAGRNWAGHGSSTNLNFAMTVHVDPDGTGGRFEATHLLPPPDGRTQSKRALNVAGEWKCRLIRG